MTAYLPVFACLGLWLVLGASLALLRRALAGPSRKPPSDPGDAGPDIDSGSPRPPLALLAPALCGAVLLLALGAAGSGLASSGAGALPVLLLVLAIALIHVARRGALPDAPETP